jgi:CubicO group peptidase (beta-lactamase class C family)
VAAYVDVVSNDNTTATTPQSAPPVAGHASEVFPGVAAAFAANFSERLDVGAAVAVWHDGELAVDLWGGWADARAGRAWERDTLQLVFSTTKGPTAACVVRCAQLGLLDLDAPVAQYWPEFNVNGKESVTTRHILGHRSGLPAFAERISVAECNEMGAAAARLAGQAPEWEPGSSFGYHALTYGWLLGEIVHRVTGMSIGEFWRHEFADPEGLEIWIGLPSEHESRVSRLTTWADGLPPDPPSEFTEQLMTRGSMTRRVFSNPPQVGVFNDVALHAAQWPAANGIATARSLATFYGLLGTGRWLDQPWLEAASTPQSTGFDQVLRKTSSFGLGFATHHPEALIPPGAIGHAGAGGSLAFCDPATRTGFAYVMNAMAENRDPDPRVGSLVRALANDLRRLVD